MQNEVGLFFLYPIPVMSQKKKLISAVSVFQQTQIPINDQFLLCIFSAAQHLLCCWEAAFMHNFTIISPYLLSVHMSFQHCAKIHNINLLQMCYTSSSEVRPPHYLRPALASLCLVLEHLCQGRLLPLQDLGLCRRSQGKKWRGLEIKKG